MNIAKSALLLAGLLSVGSIFAQESEECGRHVRVPSDVIVAAEARFSDVGISLMSGHIDADVLDFHHKS